jgi:hypothetical protein
MPISTIGIFATFCRCFEQHQNHLHVALALQQMRRKRMAQSGVIQLPSPAASAAMWHALSWRAAMGSSGSRPGNQPASRPALQPPGSQQLEKLGRQHGMPILAALAHLDADQHALGIDAADPEHNGLTTAQTGAVRDG